MDRTLSDTLDDDHDDPAALEHEPAAVAEADRSATADALFIHALLDHIHGFSKEDENRRLRKLMMSLVEMKTVQFVPAGAVVPTMPTTSPTPATPVERPHSAARPRRQWIVSALGLAACIAIVAGLFFMTPAKTVTAAEVMQRAIAQSDRDVDRHYKVSTEIGKTEPVTSDLYVNGGSKFLWVRDAPLPIAPKGSKLYIGGDGKQFWLAPALGSSVLVGENPEYLSELMANHDTQLPFLDVSSVLRKMQQDYEVALLGHETLSGHGDTRFVRLEGTLASDSKLMPRKVHVWAVHDTGVVQRIQLDGVFGAGHIVFDLVAETPQPADWYQHSRHAPGRTVISPRPKSP